LKTIKKGGLRKGSEMTTEHTKKEKKKTPPKKKPKKKDNRNIRGIISLKRSLSAACFPSCVKYSDPENRMDSD